MDGPVRQRSLWQHNLALVLGEVGPAAPTSRARIAQATGLTRATVSALVDVLVRARLVDEVGPAPRGGAGRPATGLVLSPAGPAGLGLEINVDYLAAAVVDLTGAVRHLEVRRADQRDRPPAEVLADVAELADRACSAVAVPLAGARLAVPGLIDARGMVRLAPNLGWRDLDALGPLTTAPHWPGLPVGIDNEANLAALGELATAARERSFLYVSGEVGVGAGIVLDGALLRGTHGWSGEIGHITIAADGPTCRCGARGCLEQYAGQEAILRAAGVPAAETLPADLAVRRLVELAGAADPATVGALAAAGTALGIAAAGVVNLLDLDAVVLGGSFAPLAGWLCGQVERELATRVLTAAWSPVPVRACGLGTRAAVVGAAGAVVREVHAAPATWVDGG
ncbi:MAG TPA: ROK family transcriptional regulator [Rugosimonospora sp.]